MKIVLQMKKKENRQRNNPKSHKKKFKLRVYQSRRSIQRKFCVNRRGLYKK